MKGKASKNKSSQKNKNKTKQSVNVVVNNTPPAQIATLTSHAENAIHSMLEPDPSETWVIPRAWPVQSCGINYRRNINVTSASGCIIEAKPDLNDTVTVVTGSEGLTAVQPSGLYTISDYVTLLRSIWYSFEQDWFDAAGDPIHIPRVVVPEAGSVAILKDGTIVPGHKIVYIGNVQVWGLQRCYLEYTPTTNTFDIDMRARVFNNQLTQTAQDTFNVAAATHSAEYTNLIGILGNYGFALDWRLNTGPMNASPGTYFGLRQSVINEDTWVINTYDPAPSLGEGLYRTALETSSKYSFPLLSILIRYTGSDLLNGGTLAIGVVPHNYPLSHDPAQAFEQISALGQRVYVGPMKKGAHGVYIPDDITRIAFFGMDEKINGRRLCCAILPQSAVGTASGSVVQVEIELRCHIELINPSQTLRQQISGRICADCIESMFAAIEAHGGQVGENPSHVKRLVEMAKRAARDPEVQDSLKNVGKHLAKTALKAAPLLLTLL